MAGSRRSRRIPPSRAREATGRAHVPGGSEESHAWKGKVLQIRLSEASRSSTVVLFIRTSYVVAKGTSIHQSGGMSRTTIVSLIASGRNSYGAPGTFPWENDPPRRVTRNSDVESSRREGHSPAARSSPLE